MKVIKTVKELREQLKKDYSQFLKWHSQDPDDFISYVDWLGEIFINETRYGWKFKRSQA